MQQGTPPGFNRALHHVTDTCSGWHCFAHDVDERVDGYRTCGECRHTFATAQDLIDDFWSNSPGGRRLMWLEPGDIGFCPHCRCDFHG